ncbi:MAG TPA: hypothetical protein VKM72_08750 [Thermoanaerobaculia bacterium]|nr:hypothetical protein [Thermoanaerobaculia bacterium]
MFEKLRPILPVLLLTLAACGGGQEESAPGETTTTATEAPAAPSPIGPISSRDGAAPMAPAAGEESALDFKLPAGWQSEPASGMRLAQASIPGTNGAGQLAVFYFGPGGGGDVESNIQRWVGQMQPEPGTQPERQTFETANGFQVTWVDVAGTLLPSGMGAGPTTPQPNFRLLGAVVEGPGGPWFFKATGPKDALAAERENFLEMLRSVQTKKTA